MRIRGQFGGRASGKTADLFGTSPPADRRVLMHAIDSGSFPDGKDAAHFRCRKCGHDTGWIYANRSQTRRGRACPICNKDKAQ